MCQKWCKPEKGGSIASPQRHVDVQSGVQYPRCLLNSSLDQCTFSNLQWPESMHASCLCRTSQLKKHGISNGVSPSLLDGAASVPKHAETYQSTQRVQQILVAPILADAGFVQAAPVPTAEKVVMQLMYRRISLTARPSTEICKARVVGLRTHRCSASLYSTW